MNSMKRLAAIGALSVTAALALAACGGEDPTPTPRPAATATPTPEAMMEATPTPDAMMEATPTPDAMMEATPTPDAMMEATPTPDAMTDPDFDAEAYFGGKTIRLMVGFNPGGGTDAQARYMSRAWSEFIPGSPRLIVTNMTPNVVQRNFVWNAEPDGFTISVEATAGIFDQISPAADYDMREVSMIGVTSGKDQFWMIRGNLPYGCIDTAFNATEPVLTVGSSVPTPADLGSLVSLPWLADKFNIPLEIKNVAAAGSAEQYIMLERGDVNSWSSSTVWNQLPITRPGWIADGFLRPFVDLSYPGYELGSNAEGPYDCPKAESFFTTDEELQTWIAITGPRTYASKNVIGPPGMAPGPLNALRDALTAAMADEEFAANMTKFTGIPNNFTDGATAQQELYDTTESFLNNGGLISELQELAFEKYVK